MNIQELFEEVIEESTTTNTREYEFSHGKKPKGSGNWWIKVNGKGYNPQPNMTLGKAKSAASKMARADGNWKKTGNEIEVMP